MPNQALYSSGEDQAKIVAKKGQLSSLTLKIGIVNFYNPDGARSQERASVT